MNKYPDPDRTKALYIISVAAELAEVSATSLRRYERAGLLAPSRTRGGVRLYSDQDVLVLRQIRHLTDEWGASMTGITAALQLTQHLLALRELLQTEGYRQVDQNQRALAEIDEALGILGR